MKLKTALTDCTQSPAAIRRLHGVMLTLLAGYIIFLVWLIGAYAGGADSSGYLNHARLLATGHVQTAPREIPGLPFASLPDYTYTPLGLKATADRTHLFPTYPPGLSLWCAALAPLTGWERAAPTVIILHSVLGLLLVYALGRDLGLSRVAAYVPVVLLAGSPIYLHYSLQLMSDMPSLVWVTAAVWAALRSRRMEKTGWAVAAGAALAISVLIRPVNVLAFFPVVIALGWSLRRWIALGAGGLPGAVFSVLHNHAAFGTYVGTGYGDMSSYFSASHVLPTLGHYAKWVPLAISPLAVAALALPWLKSTPAARVLIIWIAAYLGFYATYSYTHETWWYLRFILPAAPALLVGGMLACSGWNARWGARFSQTARTAVGLGVFGLCVGTAIYWTIKLHAANIGKNERTYPEAATWVRANLPANAVLVTMQTSGALFYYTNHTLVRWDSIEPADFIRLKDALGAARLPLYAVLYPFETDEVIQKRMPGKWTRLHTIRSATIWKFEAPATESLPVHALP